MKVSRPPSTLPYLLSTCSTPHGIALERIRTEGRLPNAIFKLLREATSCWNSVFIDNSPREICDGTEAEMLSLMIRNGIKFRDQLNQIDDAPSYLDTDEKKCEEPNDITDEVKSDELNDNEIASKSSCFLKKCLQFYSSLSTLDAILMEEIWREGVNKLISHLMKLETHDCNLILSEKDEDNLEEIKDLACNIASMNVSSRRNCLPFTEEELLNRLPVVFNIEPVSTNESRVEETKTQILMNQVQKRQSAQDDVGFVVWPSAVILARWISSNSNIIRNKTILELGAGCGLTGISTAAATSAVSGIQYANSVILTDFNDNVLKNLKNNIELNGLRHTQATKLDFYQQNGSSLNGWIDGDSGNLREPVDLVVGADIICKPDDAVAVSKTIHDCLVPGGEAFIICADAKHRFGVDFFHGECEKAGLEIFAEDLSTLFDGQLMKGGGLEVTSGYVENMTFTLFHIVKVKR